MPDQEPDGDSSSVPPRARQDLVELRIHGVRDHGDFSSLGSAKAVAISPLSLAETVTVPDEPAHPLWLFNWSRSSRALGGLLWYAVLPFTLLNVAAQTGAERARAGEAAAPRRRDHDPMIAVVVTIQGLVLSCTALVWTIAVIETIGGHFSIPLEDVDRGIRFVTLYACFLLLFFAGLSWLMGRPRDPSPLKPRLRYGTLTLLNGVVVAAFASWLLAANPGHQVGWTPGTITGEISAAIYRLPFLTTAGVTPATYPAGDCYAAEDVVGCYERQTTENGAETLIDVLSCSVAAGLVVSAILTVCVFVRALVVRFGRRDDRRVQASSLAMAAFLVMSSWVMLVSFASTIRLGLYWVMSLLAPFIPGDFYHAYRHQPYFIVMPFEAYAYDLTLFNVIPLLGLAGLLAFGLCLLLSGAFVRRTEGDLVPPKAKGRGTMRFFHRTLSALDRTLLWIVLGAGALWAAAAFGLVRLYQSLHRTWAVGDFPTGEDLEELHRQLSIAYAWSQLVILVVTVLGVVTITFIMTSGGDGKLKQTFDVIADIAAFWPQEWHPFAGASYRNEVVSGVKRALEGEHAPRRIILAGHSQGSVIAYWYATFEAQSPDRIDLVTCGSPIDSLYTAVFPRWFSPRQRAVTVGRVHSWSNVWRATDPIATKLEPVASDHAPGIVDVQAPDPADKRVLQKKRVRGHGDYWTDPTQVRLVREVAGAAETAPEAALPSPTP